jgi:cytosine/creatinine deaminase
MADLLLRGGQPWRSAAPADIMVRDGVIVEVGPDIGVTTGVEAIDVSGKFVLPGLVDAHCHLDKTLWGGPWVAHSAGDALSDRISNERARRPELGLPNVDHVAALLDLQ